TVIGTEAPMPTSPTLQLTMLPEFEQVPWPGATDTNPAPPGRVSVRITPVAEAGPLLVAVITKVSRPPGRTGSGEADMLRARSATSGRLTALRLAALSSEKAYTVGFVVRSTEKVPV